ncbi:unnamed protein product [Nezara viridula]|uniref:Uncharacterized protein n=1 Tax=Nezara viridula TaxID=85310 RepID=A0A9P0E3C5_NEZVI|nr:unnamed protein product [Nezara viridula]
MTNVRVPFVKLKRKLRCMPRGVTVGQHAASDESTAPVSYPQLGERSGTLTAEDRSAAEGTAGSESFIDLDIMCTISRAQPTFYTSFKRFLLSKLQIKARCLVGHSSRRTERTAVAAIANEPHCGSSISNRQRDWNEGKTIEKMKRVQKLLSSDGLREVARKYPQVNKVSTARRCTSPRCTYEEA